ncbi:MAG: flagellar motor switch protein FliG [candidate division KSB1 bacterium]|nr:flagellar motor switch protein FliG [candidate division KSB1 bacterium]
MPLREIRYEELTGHQKAAILLIALGVEAASLLARHFSDQEIEAITKEMAALHDVPAQIIDRVVIEFYDMIRAREYIAQGGLEYARRILEQALGPKRANELLQRIERTSKLSGFEFMRRAHPNQILNLIQNEHPQTIALILSFVEPAQAARVILRLPEDKQKEVVYRMATMEQVQSELLSDLERALEMQLETMESSHATAEAGGVKTVAEILNLAGKTAEKLILDEIEARNPELADKIRDLMFTFDDLILLDDRSIQRVLKEVDTRQMALALKGASEEVKQKIFKNMSERAATILREEMEYMGPVRLRDVEEAQRQIANMVRTLEEEGEIVIARGGGSEEILV